MSKFREISNGNVIDVPDALDGTYHSRPEYEPYDPHALPVDPAVVSPAGATGSPVPEFDPMQPLAAGPVVALDHIEDIKGPPLDETLEALGLSTSGKADEKRDRLAERLNEEVNRG